MAPEAVPAKTRSQADASAVTGEPQSANAVGRQTAPWSQDALSSKGSAYARPLAPPAYLSGSKSKKPEKKGIDKKTPENARDGAARRDVDRRDGGTDHRGLRRIRGAERPKLERAVGRPREEAATRYGET